MPAVGALWIVCLYPFCFGPIEAGCQRRNNFGLSLDWGNNWVGRYTATEASLFAPQVQPTIAYKVNDWLSVGAGAGLTLGYLDAKLRVNNKEPGLGDGKMEYRDTDFAVQGNFGIMLNPTPSTRIGLRYLTETELDFEDNPDFSRMGPLIRGDNRPNYQAGSWYENAPVGHAGRVP